MTDQQHIDALSESLRNVFNRMHEQFERAGPHSTVIIVNRGDIALIPKPSPKRDPVEELADEIEAVWTEQPFGSYLECTHFTLRYLIDRGLLNMESVK